MARNKIEVDEELESGFDLSQLKRLANYVIVFTIPFDNKSLKLLT